MAATPAISALAAAGVAFEVLHYAHDPRADASGLEAAEKLDLDPETVFKTLVIGDGGGGHALALVPAAAKLALPAAARVLGWKRAAMADKADAMWLTGYVLGGISPFGTRKRLPVVVDATALLSARIHVSAGRRGLTLRLAPEALLAALGARAADLQA